MEDRRGKKGFPAQGPPKGASSLARRPLGPDDKPIDIDESACFYDWHGQPLSSDERRARLEAFRAGSRPPPPPAETAERPWSESSMPTTAFALLDEGGEIPAESEANPGERAFDLVWRDGDPAGASSVSSSTRSEAPVVATRRASRQHQRTARAVYLGLMAATVALLATAVAGLWRSNATPSLAAKQEGAATAVLAPTEPVRFSADTPARPSLAADVPPEKLAAPAPAMSEPAAVPSAVPPPVAPSPLPRSSPVVPPVAPPPAPAVPPRRPDDVKPAPPRAGPGGSSSAPSIVPGDTPKF